MGDVITGNRSLGLNLEYIAPTVVNGGIEVVIEEANTIFELQLWENALIMYVIGGELTMTAVKKFMMNVWNFVSLPDLFYNDEGCFIIKLKYKEDKETILRKGSYTIYRKPMFLHEWKPDFKLEEDALRIMPIWVTFNQLPLNFWGERSIAKISSAIGRPMMTDECTSKKLRVSYARVLIEVDVTNELKDTITIRGPRGEIQQSMEYEWRPPFCKTCKQVGHNCEQKKEKAQTTKKWIEKQKETRVIESPRKNAAHPENNVENTEDWKIVSSHKNKGKLIVEADVNLKRNAVGCSNGFEILGANDGSLEEDNT